MNMRDSVLCTLAALCCIVGGCSNTSVLDIELKHYTLNSLDSIISNSGVQFDEKISSDGKGSLRIDASESTVVRIFEINTIDIENARLIYRAKLRTKDIDGQVYLEMWCVFSDKGEFFSRNLQSPLTGTNEWTTVETPFFLEQGQNPDLIKLNVVIDGKGTAWVDDVRLLKGSLN